MINNCSCQWVDIYVLASNKTIFELYILVDCIVKINVHAVFVDFLIFSQI